MLQQVRNRFVHRHNVHHLCGLLISSAISNSSLDVKSSICVNLIESPRTNAVRRKITTLVFSRVSVIFADSHVVLLCVGQGIKIKKPNAATIKMPPITNFRLFRLGFRVLVASLSKLYLSLCSFREVKAYSMLPSTNHIVNFSPNSTN